MKHWFAILAAAVAAPASAAIYPDYGATALQIKVDRSFSPIAIYTPYPAIRARLVIAEPGCKPITVCKFRDGQGVRYVFDGESARSMIVQVKGIVASSYGARPIAALGIGTARSQAEVVAAVSRFDPELKLDCAPPSMAGDIGHHGCSASTGPGWIEIGFDEENRLTEARLYGYFV